MMHRLRTRLTWWRYWVDLAWRLAQTEPLGLYPGDSFIVTADQTITLVLTPPFASESKAVLLRNVERWLDQQVSAPVRVEVDSYGGTTQG